MCEYDLRDGASVKTMLRAMTLLLGFACGMSSANGEDASQADAAKKDAAVAAVRGMLQRVAPQRAEEFVLSMIPGENGRDVFEIETVDDRVAVRGSSANAIAAGVGWYARHCCRCDISWRTGKIAFPSILPRVSPRVRQVTPYAYRYFFNYCAFSYTMAWWDWAQWEHMIDWMALYGINMPLAVTGQEAVWRNLGRSLGLTDAEMAEFLVGPAYLPFGWMGCIDGWGGPLPQTWIDSHLELGRKIAARERELGMKPVLQGFTGHVPMALKRVFPQAKFQQLPSWCGFPGTHFLDPLDPLFRRLGSDFVREQTRLFGTDHLYASDTFIEMSPPSNDPAFLDAMGKSVFAAMQQADPDAVWVMQGWLFINNPNFWKPPQAKALLTSVPDDRLLVLDLMCESSPAWKHAEAFYGKPWLFGIIQTFGDTVSLHGGLPQIAANLKEAIASPAGPKLRGTAHIMEGLGCNPVVHDFLADITWRSEVPGVDEWLNEYVVRRYGKEQAKAIEAWSQLLGSAYSSPGASASTLCTRPSLHLPGGSGDARVAAAWQTLLSASAELRDADAYQYDVVNIARQSLSGLIGRTQRDAVMAYQRRDRKALSAARVRFAEMIGDLDTLLAARPEFLLGSWLSDAKRWATTDDERKLYEWNARNQITLWGPRDSDLHDYAQKQWAGVVRDFYGARWIQFLDRLDASLAEGKEFDAVGFERDIRQWEENWTRSTSDYPAEPKGNAVELSQRLFDKYGSVFRQRDAISLTTDKPATCSHALPAYPAALANDGMAGDTDSYWATDTHAAAETWWQVDLQKATTVSRVVLVFYYGDERRYGFTVQTSLDGRHWETVVDRRDSPEASSSAGVECRFSSREVRYLRVDVTSNSANSGRHLVEVMAYDK
jgi:alpha-N-acetylglucosaminidase